MFYKFPEINHIDDVMPYVDDNFKVTKHSYGTVITYHVASNESFPPVTDYGSAVRREFRGIMFDNDTGEVISRPFHKFFNVGEREEVSIEALDLSRPHKVYRKMDGSMIRPFLLDGEWRLATKAGISDVACEAELFLEMSPLKSRYHTMFNVCEALNLTPIFEYTAPSNRIVVSYADASLTLLAVRDNKVGDYLDLRLMEYYHVPITVEVDSAETMAELSESVRVDSVESSGEGVVIYFADGMAKCKSQEYVDLHRVKSDTESEHSFIAGVILKGRMDDMLPLVDVAVAHRMRGFESEFFAAIDSMTSSLRSFVHNALFNYSSKKEFALSSTRANSLQIFSAVVFKALDNADDSSYKIDYRELVLAFVTKAAAKKSRWVEFKESTGFDVEWGGLYV